MYNHSKEGDAELIKLLKRVTRSRPTRARSVANYFLYLAQIDNGFVDPVLLMKLVYIAHGWHLAIYDEPLVSDEAVQFWNFGPVFPSLFEAYSYAGDEPITGYMARVSGGIMWEKDDIPPPSNKRELELIQRVWDVYKDNRSIELSRLTVDRGTPWWDIARKYGKEGQIIENRHIAEYFKNLAGGGKHEP